MARWGIGRGRITGSKFKGGRGGWETERSNVYSGGGGLGEIIMIGTRRKRGEALGTGTLAAPPRVEIPLTGDVLAGECAFRWKTRIDGMLVMKR